jgi:hypothetical protein
VRITQGAAVGHVQAPHPNAAAGRAQGAGFRRGGHLGFATPAGLAVEADLHIVQTNARGDCHTVPLIEADVCDLVAEFEQRQSGELAIGAFGLLHGQYVDVGASKPVDDAVQAGADRIHIPGGEPQGAVGHG